jgi:hemolysin activation/secretion protein
MAVMLLFALPVSYGYAQSLPGAAEVDRIEPRSPLSVKKEAAKPVIVPKFDTAISIPEAAQSIEFMLHQVRVEGATALTKSQLHDIYAPYLGKKVTLEVAWQLSGQIAERYYNRGYFLTRVYVPAQEITDGTIILKVVEGSVGKVVLDDTLSENPVIERLMQQLVSHQPLSAEQLESFMLRLNDLAGYRFFGALQPYEGAPEGQVLLSVQSTPQAGQGIVTIDNYGSRFLGPYQGVVAYQHSFLAGHQTTFTGSTSIPPDELQYIAVQHEMAFSPEVKLHFSGNMINANPGSSLEVNNIESQSAGLELGVTYQPVRQRQENLTLGLMLSGKNSDSDILGNTTLTRDRIRAVRGDLAYDTDDRLSGYNYLNFRLSQGLNLFGSSDKGDLNLSRSEADPEFTTLRFSYLRQQSVTNEWMLNGKLAGQFASGPLYSAEEFDYGGQRFGRAYNPSEITGDHGIAGALELRYLGMEPWHDIAMAPYGFYDIGQVWNEDTGSNNLSAASVGIGMELSHDTIGLSGNLGIAWPLTRTPQTPLYGEGKSPRILMELGYNF